MISIDAILDPHNLEEWEAGYISVRSFIRANDVAIVEAGPLLTGGTPAIFDGNFYYRSQIDDLGHRLKSPGWVFTLRAPLSECIERDRRRAVSLGEVSVREVFAKAAEVEGGIDVDALRPVADIVAAITQQLRQPSSAGQRASSSHRGGPEIGRI